MRSLFAFDKFLKKRWEIIEKTFQWRKKSQLLKEMWAPLGLCPHIHSYAYIIQRKHMRKRCRATLTKAKEINRSKQYITLHTRLRSPFNVHRDLRLTIAHKHSHTDTHASIGAHAHTLYIWYIRSPVWYFPISKFFSLMFFFLLHVKQGKYGMSLPMSANKIHIYEFFRGIF